MPIGKTYKGNFKRKKKKGNLHDDKLAQTNFKISPSQQLITCNSSVMVMGGVSRRDGSRELARPIATAQLKMENACILCNISDIFLRRKVTKIERGQPSSPLKLQIALKQFCKNTSCLCKHPNTSSDEKKN